MIFVIIRLITQLINQLRKKEIISFLSKQIVLQMCSNFALKLRPDHKINQKNTSLAEHIGTVGICPHLLLGDTLTLFPSRGQIKPTLI